MHRDFVPVLPSLWPRGHARHGWGAAALARRWSPARVRLPNAYTREDLWQTMHDLRDSLVLRDQDLVLPGRPARTQAELARDPPADCTLDSLFETKAQFMLHDARDQRQTATAH